MTRVGAFQAKTHLPQLLEKVEAGESIVITRHGKEVAHLVPPPDKAVPADMAQVVSRWKKARRGVKLRGLKVRELINRGRQ